LLSVQVAAAEAVNFLYQQVQPLAPGLGDNCALLLEQGQVAAALKSKAVSQRLVQPVMFIFKRVVAQVPETWPCMQATQHREVVDALILSADQPMQKVEVPFV
jgi:hypothetical protein